MDMEPGKQHLLIAIKKYQYIFWILLLGILLMLLPEAGEKPQTEVPDEEAVALDLEAELSSILSQIAGVGTAEVLLTEVSGSQTVYQMDTGQIQNNLHTVIVMDDNRSEQGLVQQVLSPVYRGAVVVCQGADNAHVRLSVVNAVKSATGLSSDCITVVKMN